MGRNKTLAKNMSFVVIGNIGSKLMGFFLLPLYTSWLSPSDYGITDIISVYASLLLNLVACDMADAIFVFPSGAEEGEVKKYFSTGFFFQVFCSCLLALLFWGLSFLPYENSFFSNIWFIYFILISSLFQAYSQNFCRGINKMSVFSFTGIVNSVTIALFSLLLIPTYGVLGYVVATIAANIITGLFTFFYSKSYKFLDIAAFSTKHLIEMLKYSIPLMPTAVIWWLIFGLNRPLVEEYCGLFALGLLAVAGKLPSVMGLSFNIFQQAWMITVLEEYKKDGFASYYNKMFQLVFFAQVVVCMAVTIAAQPFITVMTTEQYAEAWKYIPLVTIGTLFSNVSAFAGTVFTATRQSKYTFLSVISGGVTSLVLNFALIPFWGLWGACLSVILAHLVSALTRIHFSKRFVEFRNVGFYVTATAIAIICYLCCFAPSLLLRIVGYVVCFAALFIVNRKQMAWCYQFVGAKLQGVVRKIRH